LRRSLKTDGVGAAVMSENANRLRDSISLDSNLKSSISLLGWRRRYGDWLQDVTAGDRWVVRGGGKK